VKGRPTTADYVLGALGLTGLAAVILGAYLIDGWDTLWSKLLVAPVLLAAWRFGLLGGALTAAVGTAALAPQLLVYWGELDVFVWGDIAELLTVNLFGWALGLSSDYHRRRGRQAEALADQLAVANAELAELVELRERAARLERLETVGRLAGGVAHELRNPLAAIKLTAQTIDAAALPIEDREALEIIVAEVERADETVRRLLGEARGGGGERRRFDFVRLCRRAADEVAGRARNLRLELELPDEELPVHGSPDALRQAVVNVLVNALESARSRVIVELRAVGGTVELAVADDGPGVGPAAREHLFEPFFTTKEDGTGLGLFLAAQAVRAAGGELIHDPPPAGGARFVIRLPSASD
jgi:signal transduction histidine kinase